MKCSFNFLFYWLFSYRMRKSNDVEVSIDAACFGITMIQLLLLYDLLMLIKWFYPFTFNIPKLAFVAIVLSIGFILKKLNLRHYSDKVQTLSEKYENHPATHWFRIWMYFVIYFGLYFLPFIMSTIINLFL